MVTDYQIHFMEINMTPAEGKKDRKGICLCVESEGTGNPFPVPYICSVVTYCGSKKSKASPKGDNSPGKINASQRCRACLGAFAMSLFWGGLCCRLCCVGMINFDLYRLCLAMLSAEEVA